MREIEFQAWDAANAKMLSWDAIKLHHIMPGHSSWKWREYTGLKDKTGRKIYEGDILNFDEKEWGGKHNFVIGWNERDARFSGDGVPHDWTEWCEVIGSIYENPELLEAVK